MARRTTSCPAGCISFCDVPVGGYYRSCGPRALLWLRTGSRPITAYKKVSGPRVVRGVRYEGGAVEMLLKRRGYGEKAAPYFPVRGCPCVRYLGRDRLARQRAIQAAERYQAWRARQIAARRRRAAA